MSFGGQPNNVTINSPTAMLSNTQARNASPSNSNRNLSVQEPRHQVNSHSQIAPVKLGKEDSPVSSWPHEKCLPPDSARKATSLHPKDLSPASSNLPCFSKTTAKLLTEVSVSGCLGPSWDSKPSKARWCSPSAWRLEMER